MEKEIFKVGDKVYHAYYGWGEVHSIDGDEDNPINVDFKGFIMSFTKDGKEDVKELNSLLSFTEYTLQGFSQERPIVLPEYGELCLMSTSLEPTSNWDLIHFGRYRNSEVTYRFESMNGGYYAQIIRIKILD